MRKNYFLLIMTQPRFILSLLLIIFGPNAFALNDLSIASVSANLMEPIHGFTDTVYSICYVVAITIFVASIAQYRAYRLSPNQTPLNRPIVLVLLSLAVAFIPFISRFSEAAKYTTGY